MDRVPARSYDSDPLDIAILGVMYREGSVNLAGIDPRLNATRVARVLRTGRARVAARLRAWHDTGFLRKYDVWPNPALLGWHGAWVALRVADPKSKPALFRRLALVDGVVAAMEFLGPWVSVALVAPDPATLDRRAGLLRNLAGVEEIDGPVSWVMPEPKRPLSTLDLRIVRALRERPAGTLSEIARRVGVSTRTMTRRYADLLDDWAVWFVPVFDFRALPYAVVSLNVRVRTGLGRDEVSKRIRDEYPLTLEFTSAEAGPVASPNELVFFVTLPSAAHIDELERLVAAIEGVEGVEMYVLVRILDFPEWFDAHLDGLLRETTARRAVDRDGAPAFSRTGSRAGTRSRPGPRSQRG